MANRRANRTRSATAMHSIPRQLTMRTKPVSPIRRAIPTRSKRNSSFSASPRRLLESSESVGSESTNALREATGATIKKRCDGHSNATDIGPERRRSTLPQTRTGQYPADGGGGGVGVRRQGWDTVRARELPCPYVYGHRKYQWLQTNLVFQLGNTTARPLECPRSDSRRKRNSLGPAR